MRKFTFFPSLVFSLLLVSTAHAARQTPINAGLAVGSQVPEITALTIAGKKATIAGLSGDKGLVLVLFRSADWCPYCKRHLKEINQWSSRINELGYGLAAISYDSRSILEKFSEKHQLQYPLLADQSNQTMQDFKVLNKDVKAGHSHYGIPYPGVMIIDKQGKLVYKYFYLGYKKRVKFEQLYQDLVESKY